MTLEDFFVLDLKNRQEERKKKTVKLSDHEAEQRAIGIDEYRNEDPS
jgi:hypothetical protein